MIKLLTFGETMVQYNATYIGPFREDGTYILDCAGAESNVVVNLGKLGLPNVETVWVSRLGDDDEGTLILQQLARRTIIEAKKYKGEKTGISYLNHLENHQHVKTYYRKGSAASLLSFQDVAPYLETADMLHITGITPALSDSCRDTVFAALHFARTNRIAVSFDTNYREQLWRPEDARLSFEKIIRYSILFKVGYDEAETVWANRWSPEKYAKYFRNINRGMVIVTLGDQGAIVYDGDIWVSHPGYKVKVVDPIGAGDAFLAGFLGGMLEKSTLKEYYNQEELSRRRILKHCLEVANVCGALTCTRRGDTAAMPTMQEIREFIRSRDTMD